MKKTPRQPSKRPKAEPALAATDFQAYLHEKAAEIAPRDVAGVLERADEIRLKATRLAVDERLRRRLNLSLHLLRDHLTGEAPQIPMQTVAVLAVAVLYFLDPIDAIPDELPRVGTLDDGLLFELAFSLARPGIQRYCDFKDLKTDGIFQD